MDSEAFDDLSWAYENLTEQMNDLRSTITDMELRLFRIEQIMKALDPLNRGK